MRGGASVYRLHADLAERARLRQPGLLPGESLPGGRIPLPWEEPPKKPEPKKLVLSEDGMPVAF